MLNLKQFDTLSVVFLLTGLANAMDKHDGNTYYLAILPSNIVHAAIRVLHHKITSKVSPERAVVGPTRRTCDERLSGFLRVIVIATTSCMSFNEKFTYTADGEKLMMIFGIYDPYVASRGISDVFGISSRRHSWIGQRADGALAGTITRQSS